MAEFPDVAGIGAVENVIAYWNIEQSVPDLGGACFPRRIERAVDHQGSRADDNGKTQNAIAIFNANLQQYPKSASAYNGTGGAYLRSGQKDLAIESYKNALKLGPHDQNATEALRNLKQD